MKLLPLSFGQIVAYGVVLLFANSTLGQDILWEKSLGGRYADYLTDALATPDYGFIIAGSSLSKNSGNKIDDSKGDLDYWIWKMNEEGEPEWQKSFGGSGTDLLQSIKLTRDGGFILAGTSNSNKSFDKSEDSKGQDDFWVIKLNAGGGMQWQKTIGGNGQEKLNSVAQTADGGYILGGTSDSDTSADKTQDNFGSQDYWIVKINDRGEIQWQKTYGGIFLDELENIEQTADQGYIVGGYSNSPASGNKSENNYGFSDYWILKLDNKGEIQWQKTLGGSADDQLSVIHQLNDGNYLIGGNSNSESSFEKKIGNSNGTDFWVLKMDNDQNILWQETYNIASEDILTSIVENNDGTILLAGYAKSEVNFQEKDDRGVNDFMGIKIKENGEEIWRKSVGSYGEDILKKLIETRDGGYLLAGTSNPALKGNQGYGKPTKKKTKSSIKIGNGKNIKALDDATELANQQAKEINDAVNKFFNDHVNEINKKTKELTDKLNKDSRVKMGMNSSMGNLFNNDNPFGSGGSGDDLLSGITGMGDNKSPNSSASGDKEKNYGKNDFWIVKLKDKMKPTKDKVAFEAFPNPTSSFTNIIIGFDFSKGYATITNMAGITLNQFEFTNRTVPVDLTPYPMGIYIVFIKTDNGSEGIKIIKSQK